MFGGMSQPVSVGARSADGDAIIGAQCKLQNSKGTWYTTTPGTVTVHRAYGDLMVSCKKEGETVGNTESISEVRGLMFANILVGLLGVGVDLGTGAGFAYPRSVTVESDRKIAAFSDAPMVAAVVPQSVTVATIPPKTVSSSGTAPVVTNQASDDILVTELPAVERQVPSGAETMVAAHADAGKMCGTSGPAPSVQVLNGSQHGTVEIKQGEFAAPGVHSSDVCGNGKIYGTQIYYQPQAGFHGTDHVRYTVVAATGRFTRMVDIDVK